MHPFFRDAWAKFDRAEQQFADIKRKALSGFEPEKNPIQRHEYRQSGRIAWVWKDGSPEHSVELSLDLGQMFHNLRSCLDHVAWAFARVGARRAGLPAPHNRTAFPLLEDQAEWRSALKSQLRDVPQLCQAFIERFQPYQGRNRSLTRNLQVIAKLDNTDKHSLLNVFEPRLVRAELVFLEPDTDIVVERRSLDVSRLNARPGAELLNIQHPTTLDVKLSFAFSDLVTEPREGIILDVRGEVPRLIRTVRFVLTKAEALMPSL